MTSYERGLDARNEVLSTGDPIPNCDEGKGSAVIVIGVDAHKPTHTVVAVEQGTGRLLGELTVEAREPEFAAKPAALATARS